MRTGRGEIDDLSDLGILQFTELGELAQSTPRYLVRDLILRQTVNLLVGDSGLGKTPLAVQLGLAVAGDVQFLGRKVQTAKVLYCDAESGVRQFRDVVRAQCRHLGLKVVPDEFRVWSPNFVSASRDVGSLADAVLHRVQAFAPDLVIIDPVRAFWPSAEEGSREAIYMIRRQRELCGEVGCSWLNVHHPRKRNYQNPVSLEDDRLRWFEEAAGSRALINNTDARLGVEPANHGDADLILAGFARLVGYIEPQYLERVCNSEGKPLGYRHLEGADFLNPRYRDALASLPKTFQFKDVYAALGGTSGSNTKQCLGQCLAQGLIRKLHRGRGYEKTELGVKVR